MAAADAVRTGEGLRLGKAVAPLLALGLFIQYIDRGNIATAAPLIKNELHLSAAQIGLLISAFYWSYVPGNPLSGWLAHRLNAYRTLALGLTLWSLATIGTAFAGGFAALLALRLLLGLGESAFFPCSSRVLAQHMPADRLAGFNALIFFGMSLGPAVGTWVGGNLMALTGWRASFLIFGALSLLWLAPWRQATRHLDRADLDQPKAPSPSFRQIAGTREVWGTTLGHFSEAWGFYFVISWLPLYLVQKRGFSMGEMASLASAVYVTQAISTVAAGWLADRWIASGASVNLARKAFAITGHVLFGGALVLAAVDNTVLSIACLVLAAAGFGVAIPSLFSISQTLAGPQAGGKWMGFENGFANLAGIVMPVITGLIIDATGSYAWAFIVSGVISLAGILCWGVIIRKVAPVDWKLESAPHPAMLEQN